MLIYIYIILKKYEIDTNSPAGDRLGRLRQGLRLLLPPHGASILSNSIDIQKETDIIVMIIVIKNIATKDGRRRRRSNINNNDSKYSNDNSNVNNSNSNNDSDFFCLPVEQAA